MYDRLGPDQPITPPRRPKTTAANAGKWKLIGLLWVAYFLNQADRQVFAAVVPLLRADLGLTASEIGLVAGAFTIVFGLLVPFSSILGTMYGRATVLVLSLIVFSGGTLLTATAGGILGLLLFRSLATGAGEGLYTPSAVAEISARHSDTRGRALAVHQTALYVGVVFGGWAAGWIGEHYGWRWSFILFGLAGLLWSGFLYSAVKAAPVHRESPRQAFRILKEAGALVATTPSLRAHLVGFLTNQFAVVSFITWMPTMMSARFDLGLARASFEAMFWHNAAAYLSVLLFAAIGDRLALRWPIARALIMASALFLYALIFWMMPRIYDLTAMAIALAAFGLFRGAYDSGLWAAVAEVAEDRLRGGVSSLIICCGYIISAVSPLLLTLVADPATSMAGCEFLAAVSLAGAAVYMLMLLAPAKRA